MPGKDYDKRIFRLLFMLNKLDSGENVSAQGLSKEFNVSVRSVQRDIDILQTTGFLLSSPERGIYVFEEGFSLKKMKLSREEASVLSLINDTVRSFGDPFKKTFGKILKKVIQQEYSSPYFFKLPRSESLKKYSFVDSLEDAIRLNQKVMISYESGSKIKDYHLLPLKIAFYEGLWYLLANTEKTSDLVKFRIEKIKGVKVLKEYFKEPENLRTILERSVNAWFSEKEGREVVLRVSKSAAEFFAGHQHFPCQKVLKKEKDGTLFLQARAAHDMEIIPAVLKWIPHIRVLKPEDLNARIEDLVRSYLGKA